MKVKKMIEWLKEYAESVGVDGDEFGYSLNKINAVFEVKKLTDNGYFILKRDTSWLSFAVMTFRESDGENNILVSCVFHGIGPSGTLRECRHTWWGDDGGYLFYPDGELITAAFKELSKYYDDMAE